jgi:serine/threonine-protein kinase
MSEQPVAGRSAAEPDWSALREEGLAGFKADALPPTLKLPALPDAVSRFVERSSEPDVSPRELAGIIETDTGLTMELLRHVNSAFVGLRQPARGVQQALTLLGIRQSKMFIVTTGLQAAVRARKSKLIHQGNFWNASLQKALFAREVAGILGADREVAFSGGLLQDFLLPVVTNELLADYLKFVSQRDSQADQLCEFERAALGWDHATAAAALAHRWRLPDELVCCLLYHHRGLRTLADPALKRTPVAAVALSALLPDQLRQERHGLEMLRKLGEKWSAFDLNLLAESVDRLQAEMGLGVANDFPLSRRCAAGPGTDEAAYSDGSLRTASISA